MQIRRVKMDDRPNRGDVMWLLFEDGDIAHPLRVLTDFELDHLLEQIDEQGDRDGDKEPACPRS